MPNTDYYIRKLEASDNVKNFSTGKQSFLPLKTFLQKQANHFQQSSIAQTYVAATVNNIVIGFVTLTCSEIDLQDGYDIADCSHANNYEFLPAVKIARLAVDARYRGNEIGSTLVGFAIAMILDRIAENVGCRFVVTDAKSEAVSFYKKLGFVLLDSDGNKSDGHQLMFLDLAGLE